jgi:Flp pilus assembly protein TadG
MEPGAIATMQPDNGAFMLNPIGYPTRVSAWPPARRGVAMIYVVVMMTTLMGLCSLALDVAHIQIVNTQLQRAADAAAQAAVAQLSNGTTATTSAATSVATENTVDDQFISSSQVTVQLLNWTSSSNYTVVSSAALANAVQVSISDNVPFFFATVLGFSTHVATRTSTAADIVQTSTQFISTLSNPWLAGEPDGTEASQPDPGWAGQGVNKEHPWQYDVAGPSGGTTSWGESYASPVQMSINVTPGATITLSNVTGQGNNDFTESAEYDATGNADGYQANYDDAASGGVSEHGIADVTMPINSVNAVFLGSSVPDSNTAPPILDFSTQAERDYTAGTNNSEATGGTFAPQLQQVFYVGNGVTSTGQQESIVVPTGATRMFLGTMDGWEWSNNSGGFTVTITQTSIAIVE